jgi:hypothetical protein
MKKPTAQINLQQAESLGQILQSFFLSIQLDEFKPILKKYGITEFKPDGWYPTAIILEVFQEIEKQPNAMQNLVSIGLKVTEASDFKTPFPTLDDLLAALPALEHQMHRNCPSGWEVRTIGQKAIEVIDRTIWPHDLQYGVLYGLCRVYQDQHDYLVERVDICPDPQTGSEYGVYHITWH